MKVLVIPDIHLKPQMFNAASDIMDSYECEKAVFVGDLVDDWGCQENVELYEATIKSAIQFVKKYPNSLWCFGNHDLAYLWDQYDHPGYSEYAADTVASGFERLIDAFDDPENAAIVHRIDNCIFSHAGLTKTFVESNLYNEMDDIDYVIDTINTFGYDRMWESDSPIWVRPQLTYPAKGMYPDGFLQIVGHTPVEEPYEQKDLGVLSVDTFSTDSRGELIGNSKMCILDTVSKEYSSVVSDCWQ